MRGTYLGGKYDLGHSMSHWWGESIQWTLLVRHRKHTELYGTVTTQVAQVGSSAFQKLMNMRTCLRYHSLAGEQGFPDLSASPLPPSTLHILGLTSLKMILYTKIFLTAHAYYSIYTFICGDWFLV